MQKIYYVSAPVGAGKSYALLEHINKTTHAAHIIATQTNAVSDEHASQLPNASLINSEERGTSAWSQLRDQIDDEHSVLICNQQVVLNQFGRSIDRHLYMDELPDIHKRLQTRSKITGFAKVLLPKIIYITDDTNKSFIQIFPTPELDLIAREGFGVFSGEDRELLEEVAQAARSPHHLVYLEAAPWRFVLAGEERKLTFHIITLPSIFRQFEATTLLGANAENSLATLVWTKLGLVEFEPHPMGGNLQYNDLSHKADLVNLYYFSELAASKTLFDNKEFGGRAKLFGAVRDAVSRMYNGKTPPHIVCFNKDFLKPENIWTLPNAEIISPDSRGINKFKDRTVAICLAALNDTPDTINFFQSVFDISGEKLAAARTYERYSQFFGRTALRDYQSKQTVDLFCFDHEQAMFMQELIPGVRKPQMIDLVNPEPALKKIIRTKQKDMTVEERREYDRKQKAIQRARKRAAAAEQVAQL